MAYFVIFYTITAGQNGPMLGTDEEEVVFLIYLVYDGVNDKIISEKLLFVKPRTADINENILSDECRADYILNETLIKSSQSLESVIEEFDQYLKRDLAMEGETSFFLVTDGQLHLRQCLHPEACSKNIELPEYYNTFFDLRKEFMKFYKKEEAPLNVTEMLKFLDIQPLNSENLGVSDAYNMVKIIQRLLEDGHDFNAPETVNMKLEPGICSKNEEIESNCVVRARGLPWQSSDQDIAKFFRGLNVAKGGVALCLSPQGRRNGEALVRFINREHRDMALKRHKHHIGNRYIEVYKATGEDFVNVAGGSNNEAQAFLSRGGLVIVRMRGLPYDCTARQVEEFFEQGEKSCSVMDGEDGVLFVKKPDGRATGDAFVMFAREEDAANALSKHREIIGFRYIELFRSTTAEVQQVLNRSMDPRTYEQQQPLISQIPQVPQLPIIPQQVITAGTKKDCVRLRGLPYEAQVEHVIDFLGEHSKSIVLQGAHLVYNAQGQPSGEAFIQMDSETSAQMCAQQKHHKYMTFGKKQRYIEVFQCSGDDMNLVLTGGLPAASQRPLLSPGMLTWDPNSLAAKATFASLSGQPTPQLVLPHIPTAMGIADPLGAAAAASIALKTRGQFMAPTGMSPLSPVGARHALDINAGVLVSGGLKAAVSTYPGLIRSQLHPYGQFGGALPYPGVLTCDLGGGATTSSANTPLVFFNMGASRLAFSQAGLQTNPSKSGLPHTLDPNQLTKSVYGNTPSVGMLPLMVSASPGSSVTNTVASASYNVKRSFEQAFPSQLAQSSIKRTLQSPLAGTLPGTWPTATTWNPYSSHVFPSL